MKRIIKYFFIIIISVLLTNYLTLIIWGKDNLLSIASRNYDWNDTNYKIDLIVWNDILIDDNNHNSLKDFNDTQIKDFIKILQKSTSHNIIFKPETIHIDSIQSKENEFNIIVFYKMNFIFYCETFFGVYSPGFASDKTEYLFWFFGWHKLSEPTFGIS